jgi:hypothetical protein
MPGKESVKVHFFVLLLHINLNFYIVILIFSNLMKKAVVLPLCWLRAFQSQLGSIKSMACRNIIMGTH